MSRWRSSSRSAATFFDQQLKLLDRFIEQGVELDTPDKQGATQREHLTKLKELMLKNGRGAAEVNAKFKELEPVEFDRCFSVAVSSFLDLSRSRGTGSMGNPLAISFLELEAYCRLTNLELLPIELEAIRVMDAAFLRTWSRLQGENNETG